MVEFRFYFLTCDGHIVGPAVDAELEDEARALCRAVELGRAPIDGATDVEVWSLKRRVGKVPI
jgi:hypothetical protein